MRRTVFVVATLVAGFVAGGWAQQPSTDGPYKVLKTARVGGEGGWDYIFADVDGRHLYIPRGQTREVAATATTPAAPAVAARITVFNLDTMAPEPQVDFPGTGANGVAVCAKTGHGFASGHPAVVMFDTKTSKLIKTIDVPEGFAPDGIYCDSFNDRTYVFSHPTKSALVVDSKDGSIVGTVDLGGTPEQGVADGKGTLYDVMQAESNIAVVDVKTLKTTAHYDFAEKGGRCNGLALDAKNHILFIACGNNTMTATPGQPAQPTMVIMSATDGKILATLPLAGSSDGAQFNPSTMEAFSTQGNGTLTVVKEESPTSFVVEENLQTMNGARTIAFDSKTNHLFTMSQEFTPPPPQPTPPPDARGRRGGGRGTAVPGSFTILMVGK